MLTDKERTAIEIALLTLNDCIKYTVDQLEGERDSNRRGILRDVLHDIQQAHDTLETMKGN